MPQTLHGTSSLVRLPDRTLTRLENGVAEVTRRYACRTSVATTFRSQFDIGATLPGEVGFIIKYKFSERKREDGFTEFEVTGVGPDTSITDSGGLKAQDDRTVTTFPSGLVRVDRTYVCPTANEAAFRPILLKGNQPPQDDFSPAIDGLYIFPDPNEIRRDDGFTEFRVSSYGRVNTSGYEQIADEYTSESITVGGLTGQAILKSKTLTKEVVLAQNESIDATTNRIPATPEVFVDVGIVGDVIISPFNRRYGISIRSYTARDFGFFSEITVVYAPIVLLQRDLTTGTPSQESREPTRATVIRV